MSSMSETIESRCTRWNPITTSSSGIVTHWRISATVALGWVFFVHTRRRQVTLGSRMTRVSQPSLTASVGDNGSCQYKWKRPEVRVNIRFVQIYQCIVDLYVSDTQWHDQQQGSNRTDKAWIPVLWPVLKWRDDENLHQEYDQPTQILSSVVKENRRTASLNEK